MVIDILNFSEAQWEALNYIQQEIVYLAQEKKNKRERKLFQDKEEAKMALLAKGTLRSTFLNGIYAQLDAEYQSEISDLATVTYASVLRAVNDAPGGSTDITKPSDPDTGGSGTDDSGTGGSGTGGSGTGDSDTGGSGTDDSGSEEVSTGYNPDNPDLSLTPAERYEAVKEYYMTKYDDPQERYREYMADSKTREYNSTYDLTLRGYLYGFIK